jgi:hypothetical protein
MSANKKCSNLLFKIVNYVKKFYKTRIKMSANKKRSSLRHNIVNCAEKASQVLNNKGKMCDNDKHTSLLLKIVN